MSNSVYIPPDLLNKIKKQADRENRSVSNLIQTAVKKYIKKPTTQEAA